MNPSVVKKSATATTSTSKTATICSHEQPPNIQWTPSDPQNGETCNVVTQSKIKNWYWKMKKLVGKEILTDLFTLNPE